MTSYKFKDIIAHKKTVEASEKKGSIAVMGYHLRTEHGTEDVLNLIEEKSQASIYKLKAPPKMRAASTRITHTHSDDLTGIKDYAETAVSIHGHKMNGEGREKTIYVTGGNDYLANQIAAGFKDNKYLKDYKIETNPENTPKLLRGVSENNIINKFDKKGVQIELPEELRNSDMHKEAVASSIATVVNKQEKKYNTKEQDKKAA